MLKHRFNEALLYFLRRRDTYYTILRGKDTTRQSWTMQSRFYYADKVGVERSWFGPAFLKNVAVMVFVNRNRNAVKFINRLSNYFLSFKAKKHPKTCIFSSKTHRFILQEWQRNGLPRIIFLLWSDQHAFLPKSYWESFCNLFASIMCAGMPV